MKHYTQHIGCNLLYSGNVYRLDGIQFLSNDKITLICYDISHDAFGVHLPAEDCKLILRPLSDLIKEVKINDSKIVPFNLLKNEWETLDIKNGDLEMYIDDRFENGLKYMPFDLVNKLLNWNFDISDLIKSGLAVDINTLT